MCNIVKPKKVKIQKLRKISPSYDVVGKVVGMDSDIFSLQSKKFEELRLCMYVCLSVCMYVFI